MKNIGVLNFILISSLALSGCQSPEDVALEACSNSIKSDLKAPSTFSIADQSVYYSPAAPLEGDAKSSEYQYLQLTISYDAENSYGAPLRSEQKCDFLVKDGKIQEISTLNLQESINARVNSEVCLEQTKKSRTADEPLVCFAPPELKRECCLPSEHYKTQRGDILWK
jgi:hypothetical protein